MQPEQRPFEYWIDDRYPIPAGFRIPVPSLHVLHPRSRATAARCLTFRQPFVAQTFNNSKKRKGDQSYLALIDRCTESKRRKWKKNKRNTKQEGTKEYMKLEINVPVSGLDLASLLDGEQGLFLCQNRGQNYITVAKAGHSIAFGPTPIGKPIQEQVLATVGPEPWFVTKISNSTELAELRGTFPGREGR
jgi:hypothetical protein